LVSTWITQLEQAATSHSWQRTVRPGGSSVTPHSHVVDIAVSSRFRAWAHSVVVSSRVRSGRPQSNVIVFISEIKSVYRPDGFRNRALMEIPQVEAFLAVGTFGGFRRAAAALRLTQPAVSARIRALEDSLSVRLFERGRPGHGLALSAAGRALRPHAEQLLQAVALARQAVHDIRPASGGAIQIAAVLSICTYLLPDVLKRFQSAHPDVMITVRSGHSKEVLEMVLRGDAEIGLARSLHHPEVETVSLRDDPLVLVGRAASWPIGERRARLEQIADRPLIFFDRGSSDWTLTQGLFRRAGLVPNVALEVETIETAKRMVERGMGLAFLPHLAVGRELRRRSLVAIEIVDAEPIVRSLDVIHPRPRPLSAAARALLQALRSALSEAGGPPRRRR
jgi:DNA-binding transcriptional LysR family regulator